MFGIGDHNMHSETLHIPRHAKQINEHVTTMKGLYKHLESLQSEVAVSRSTRLG